MRNKLPILALLACLTATSCVGPNNAFNGVASWNSRATNSKWWNELIYVGLWVVPVYEITLGLDAVVFNTFEFWGGTNPISPPAKFESQDKK